MSELIVYLGLKAASSIAVGRGLDLTGNYDSTPQKELIRFTIDESKKTNRIFVYRQTKGKGKGFIKYESGLREEFYAPVDNFSWQDGGISRMVVSDFNDDGISDVLFYNNSRSGMMLTYDKKQDRFLLVPVRIESQKTDTSK